MSDEVAAPVIAGLAVGVAFMLMLILALGQARSVPTFPLLTEDQAIDVMKSDIKNRIGDNVTVRLYQDSIVRDFGTSSLWLIYYQQEKNLLYFINGTSQTVSGTCMPGPACLNVKYKGADKSVADRLVYFLDGNYSGLEKSSPAYYFIDAMSGEVLWSYIGEDIYPELNRPRITQYDAIRIVESDFKARQSDYDRITGIIVNNTSGYVRIEEFRERNLTLPLVYVAPNGDLIRITDDGYENTGACNLGLHAYCGYLEPYNFDYRGRLVYGIEVFLSDTDNPPEAEFGRGFPFLYIVDANNGEIVDSTFLRDEKIRNIRE